MAKVYERKVKYSFVESYSATATSIEEAGVKLDEAMENHAPMPVDKTYGELDAEILSTRSGDYEEVIAFGIELNKKGLVPEDGAFRRIVGEELCGKCDRLFERIRLIALRTPIEVLGANKGNLSCVLGREYDELVDATKEAADKFYEYAYEHPAEVDSLFVAGEGS